MTRNKYRNKHDSLPVAAEAERVVLLPGGPARSVVVAVALAEATVLRDAGSFSICKAMRKTLGLTCLPTEVRPRDSRCLCTGLVIQLILASRRIYMYS